MDPDSLFSLFMIVLMLLLGTYFSAAETAFSALNRIRIKNMAEEGSKRASLVLMMHDSFDKLLSTLLVLNNVVTLIAAAISTLLFIRYFGQEVGATLSTVILTIVVVFFGDITPKSLAKESPEKFALFCAPFLYFCMVLLTPISYLFLHWKTFLSRIFKTSGDDDRMTEEELYSYVEEAQQDGVIDEEDRQLLDNAIEFKDRRASDILTPRIDVAGISEESTPEEISKTFFETDYSRLPVYRESIDNIIGVVHMRDFFKGLEKNLTLQETITPPLFVAPSTKITDLFKLLQTQKSHLAIVTDEYGGTAGIVTTEDILEELVGDIWDESDDIIVEFADLGDNRHKVICSAYVKDLFAHFDLPEDNAVESTSVSGWIMDMLGKVPEEGDTFTFENLTVVVHKTEHRRALECIITVGEKQQGSEETEG